MPPKLRCFVFNFSREDSLTLAPRMKPHFRPDADYECCCALRKSDCDNKGLRQNYCLGYYVVSFSALTLLVGRQEGHPACKKTERWGSGIIICLERGADLHMAQLMPLPLTVSCFSKIQIGFYLSGTGSLG